MANVIPNFDTTATPGSKLTPDVKTEVEVVAEAAVPRYEPGGTDVPIADGGTGASTQAQARTNLGATTVGAAVFTAADQAAARTAISAAPAGSYYTPGGTDVSVADGGTGASTLPANSVLLGNGAGAVQSVAPGTSGNVLTSTGSAWASSAPVGGASLSAKGDILTHNGTTSVRKAVGTNGQLLVPDSTQADGFRWTSTLSGIQVRSRVLPVAGATQPAFNTDLCDHLKITNLTVDITSMTANMTGTPQADDALLVTIESVASQLINWGSGFERSNTLDLPGASVAASTVAPSPVGGSTLAGVGGTSFTIPVPVGAASGRVAILVVEQDPGAGASPTIPTITAPSGFTEDTNSPGNSQVDVFGSLQNLTKHVYYKRLTATDTGSYAFSSSPGAWTSAMCVMYDGVIDTGSPFDETDKEISGATMTTLTPAVSITTLGLNRLLVLITSAAPTAYAFTPPAGFVTYSGITGSDPVAYISHKQQAAAGGTGSLQGTWANTEGPQIAWLGALKPASGAAGGGRMDCQFIRNSANTAWRLLGVS